MVIPLYIGSCGNKYDRSAASRNKLGYFLMEVIRRYADDGVDGINEYIDTVTPGKVQK